MEGALKDLGGQVKDRIERDVEVAEREVQKWTDKCTALQRERDELRIDVECAKRVAVDLKRKKDIYRNNFGEEVSLFPCQHHQEQDPGGAPRRADASPFRQFVGRHRACHAPPPTPTGYWDIGFGTPEEGGTLLIVGLGLLATYTGFLIWEVYMDHRDEEIEGYGQAAAIIFGPKWGMVVQIEQSLLLFFFIAATALTAGEAIYSLAQEEVCLAIMAVVGALGGWLLSFPVYLKGVSLLSALSFFCIIIAIIMNITGVSRLDIGQVDDVAFPVSGTSLTRAFGSTINIIFAYAALLNLSPSSAFAIVGWAFLLPNVIIGGVIDANVLTHQIIKLRSKLFKTILNTVILVGSVFTLVMGTYVSIRNIIDDFQKPFSCTP
eukprot:jgi/Pico_ML_1/52595/g3278.t1